MGRELGPVQGSDAPTVCPSATATWSGGLPCSPASSPSRFVLPVLAAVGALAGEAAGALAEEEAAATSLAALFGLKNEVIIVKVRCWAPRWVR